MRVIHLLMVLVVLCALIAEGRMLRVSKQKISRGSKFKRLNTKECGTNWGSFKQTDAAWKGDQIKKRTIGAVGCAMTSVTNALYSQIKKIKISVDSPEVDVTPKTVNEYLLAHNGYTADDNIFWAKLDPVGVAVHMKFENRIEHPTVAQLKEAVEACKGVIINVRGGGHWVLVTAAAEGDTFLVNDPAFPSPSYGFADISRAVIYAFVTDPVSAEAVHQEDAASPAPAPAAVDAAVTAPEAVPPPTPPEGEAAAAEGAAADDNVQTSVFYVTADADILKAANGGDFGPGGAPDVAAGPEPAPTAVAEGEGGGEAAPAVPVPAPV